MSPVVHSLAGQTLGRYRLEEKLGQGGMATVYRAQDTTLGRQVALKVMHPFIAERSEADHRFEREAKAVAGLHHPNVLELYDYAPATAEHPAYLVMELLTGPSLHRFLVEHGAPLAEVAAMLGLRVAQALAAAHGRGIVHRDVKPENVMFDQHRVVLCDFGIARIVAADGMTATGAVLGSPAYMSPEQAQSGAIDGRSDQFSLGALLYQLATGALPFGGNTPLATMARIVRGEHLPPTARNPRVPRYLERIIERCLCVEPDGRYPSAEALAEALRDGLNADGFVDVDGELAAYLRDPAGYNERAGERIVTAARSEAERARAAGETARALAAANRVLAWRPDDATALALAAGLTAGPRRARWLLGLAAAGALAAGGAAWRLHVGTLPPPKLADRSSAPLHLTDEGAGVRSATAMPVPHGGASDRATSSAEVTTSTSTGAKSSPTSAKPLPERVKSTADAAKAAPKAPKHAAAFAAVVPASSSPAATSAAAAEPTPAQPALPAADAPASLTVATSPWCDLRIDGAAHGRTPQTVTLPAGHHRVECTNPAAGRSLVRDLDLRPGDRTSLHEKLYPSVRLVPALSHADAFAVDDGAPAAGAREVEPGRRRITFYAAGQVVATRYVDVPPEGCRLVDTPAAACAKP